MLDMLTIEFYLLSKPVTPDTLSRDKTRNRYPLSERWLIAECFKCSAKVIIICVM